MLQVVAYLFGERCAFIWGAKPFHEVGFMSLSAPLAAPKDNCTTARLLYAGALGFLVAAEATHEWHLREPTEPEHWPAISVNLCFALELSLKAFIASRGGTKKKLKAIGHDLVRGLHAAQAAGYSPNHPAVPCLIAKLGPLHVRPLLSYLEGKSADLPDTRNMIAIVGHHVREVGAQMPFAPSRSMRR
jgi:hypothetical protein